LIKKRHRAFIEKGGPPTRQQGRPMERTDPVKRILDNYESDTFQRPKAEALDMLGKIIQIYQGKD
jgi:hypothetical protein